MACTCRAPARCPICNTSVRLPLSNLDRAAGAAARGTRPSRGEDAGLRRGLGHLIVGTSTCPRCGHSVRSEHSRSCVAKALTAAGVSVSSREAILAKITFPEG